MDSSYNSRHKLASIRLSKCKERIFLNKAMNDEERNIIYLYPDLIFREELKPLLQELIQIICHIFISGGELVTEGET